MNKKKRNINRFSMLIEQALIEERRVLMVNNGSRLSIVLSTVVLVIVILLISIIGLILIYPTEGGSVLNQTDDYNGMARFEVTSGKHDLEKVINSYLHQHMKTDGLSYSIDVTDQIQFNGDVRIIGKIVRLTVIFRPELQQKGNNCIKSRAYLAGKHHISIDHSPNQTHGHKFESYSQFACLRQQDEFVFVRAVI